MSTRNFSPKIKLNHKIESLSEDSRLNPSFQYKKSKILYSSKSSLTTLLKQIKNCQLDYISSKSPKNQSTNFSHTKKLLNLLKNNLASILKEKNIILKFFQKENEKIKSKVKNKLFPEGPGVGGDDIDDNFTIGNEKLYQSEISQIKLLNFQIENEIINTNYIIEHKKDIIHNLKKNPFYVIENYEIFCSQNYDNISKVSDILHDDINLLRKKFIDTVDMKSEQDMEIKALILEKDYQKNRIDKKSNYNKYIITEDIINEESKEYTNNYTKTKYNSNNIININYNNNNNNNNINSKLKSNDAINNRICIINQDQYIRKRLIFSKTISPKLISNIYHIKNKLNNKVKNEFNEDKINVIIEDNKKSILKSFNSSLDVTSSYYENNTEHNDIINLNLNDKENKNSDMEMKANMGGNENENAATDNNSGSKSNKNNQNSFVFNVNEKQNEDADYIFTLPEKE